MSLPALQRAAFEIARSKGFHDRDFVPVSAVEEALASHALRRQRVTAQTERARETYDNEPDETLGDDHVKIRLLARLELAFTELSEAVAEVEANNAAIYFVNGKPEGYAIEIADAVIRLMDTAEWMGFDLETAIKLKMEYNAGRPHMHGKKI